MCMVWFARVRVCVCVAVGTRQREPKKEMPDWAKVFSSSSADGSGRKAGSWKSWCIVQELALGLADSERLAMI